MPRFDARTLGVDQGSQLLFSDFEHDGEMWIGNGPRRRRVRVQFAEPYKTAPVVQVQVGMWDMSVQSNQRAEILAENISPDGFEIVFKTWGDTKVARVVANWTAIGEVRHEDDWDV